MEVYYASLPEITEENALILFATFCTTDYARNLLSNTRFGPFQPKEIDNITWARMLGPDVNNLHHMLVTFNTTKRFIKYYNSYAATKDLITDGEILLLLLTALIHDWGEGIVGDTNLQLKTPESEAEEIKALDKICQEVCDMSGLSHLYPTLNYVIHHIIDDPSSRLGEIFWAIENIGYLTVAIEAWTKPKSIKSITLGLQAVTASVIGNTERFLGLAKKYPPVETILNKLSDDITDVFENIKPEALELFSESLGIEIESKFRKAHKLWNNYLKQ